MSNVQERRRFARIPENLPISYEVLPEIRTEEALTKDISQEGIRFFVNSFIPKFSLVKIKLKLQKVPFNFEALVRVRWIKAEVPNNRYEIGAEFINIPKKAARQLIDYIKNILK